jgi:hypothetical protein
MKELSLNILDITENSVKAKASLVEITITESHDILTICIKDNGTGMSAETLENVRNPFYTTRKTRNVGMGIPLLQIAAEQTGGCVTIESTHMNDSPENHGTTVTATFHKNHIDFTPLGDIVSSVTTLIQGHPDVDFCFRHELPEKTVFLDTRELRNILEDVPLDTFEVLVWIKESLTEQYTNTI